MNPSRKMNDTPQKRAGSSGKSIAPLPNNIKYCNVLGNQHPMLGKSNEPATFWLDSCRLLFIIAASETRSIVFALIPIASD